MLIEEEKIKNKKEKGIPYGVAGIETKDMSSWRALKPIIDYSKCIKCLTCWFSCPDFAFEVNKEGFPKVRSKNCKGCGICAEHCPVKCIKMLRDFHDKK
jgi:2-oxoacid:acceptor oxidoreductase delta subunit (pyruvate/2-ketoisovalerate family)